MTATPFSMRNRRATCAGDLEYLVAMDVTTGLPPGLTRAGSDRASGVAACKTSRACGTSMCRRNQKTSFCGTSWGKSVHDLISCPLLLFFATYLNNNVVGRTPFKHLVIMPPNVLLNLIHRGQFLSQRLHALEVAHLQQSSQNTHHKVARSVYAKCTSSYIFKKTLVAS